jgi:hypothetical protein
MATPDPDWNDPCAVLAWITPQYYRVATGRGVIEVRHGEATTRYGQADVDKLDALMLRLRAECARLNPLSRKRRRAFIAG